MRAPEVHRKCAGGGTCADCRDEDEHHLQRTASSHQPPHASPSDAPPEIDAVLRTGGEPLDPVTRNFMEPRFGAELGGVRIHRDPRAAESARSVQAVAYTVGHHVVFDEGQYAPDTVGGRRLLAHEL